MIAQNDTILTTTEVIIPGIVDPSGLVLTERILSAPGAGEVLLEMEASGVSFAEQSMRRGRYPGQPRFPFVLGYDVVGTVRAVGAGVDTGLIGSRVAAATKTGGWASRMLLRADDLVTVPAGVDPAMAETVIVNGITAWQMLHRSARVKSGQTILVHGANGGVGTILVQLARHAGVRVIGTSSPKHHETLRALGVEPIDYNDPELAERVRELAPGGVNAAFDHLGLDSAHVSFDLLAPAGSLVVYGTASALDDDDSVVGIFIRMMSQIALWTVLPNGRSASFYNFWGGHSVRPRAFRTRQHSDLTTVLDLLAQGTITGQVAARIPLAEAASALELAESRTVVGKVVIVP